jgi:hypothetical protein
MLFLSSGDLRMGLIFHYAIEPSIGLFWALPLALKRINLKKKSHLIWMTFWVLFSFGRSEFFRIRSNSPTEHQIALRTQILPCIHPTATLAASGALVPHLATRPWIHVLPNLDQPIAVDCIVYDGSVNQWPMTEASWTRTSVNLHSDRFELLWQCGGTEIFQRAGSNTSCLVCQPKCDSR